MKKLLAVLTSISAVFLLTAGVLVIENNNKSHKVAYNAISWIRRHKTSGDRLTDIGYYKSGSQYIIQQIPPTISVIAAELPEQITSLRNAFYGNKQHIRWEKPWDTKNITDMSGMFYDAIWLNDESIKKWDTSKVTDMSRMFHKAKTFNQDLSSWNVSNVRNFQGMFEEANEFNNGDKPLDWGEKLKNAKNMSKMFKNTPKFKQNLNNWLMKTEVNKNDFGLDTNLHPMWYVKPQAQPPATSGSASSNSDISARSDDSNSLISSDNNVMPDNETSIIKPNSPVEQPPVNSTPKGKPETLSEKLNLDNEIPKEEKIEQPKKENESSTKNKEDDHKSDKNLYKIPSYKPNTVLKSNSSNAAVIAGAVLGSFSLLGIGTGAGYYYRKNLKNFYLKSADKMKPIYVKSKDGLKEFYNKSKTKIKDRLSKIKSKK
ncbi:BspA family leucine-rich repeat surface protein [Mycoplasma feriruminatoris]|uniref:Uncharacterized protein n=1 Tax=Mycoplasma feriruminatoris TaxID=1179777 RepID=A0A654INB9_9MOLU|nr:hypothetical protein MF5583_00166 [Mycoplasma feriruminatoris]